MRRDTLYCTALVALRLLACAAALCLGFVALSDDDYARLTIAQAFALRPRLDPSGTSWLPIPFWCTGGLMMLLGDGLWVGRALSLALSALSTVLLYAVARASGLRSGAALTASALVALTPIGVFAGVATVPELPTATLLASGVVLLRRTEWRFWMLGASLLTIGALCRYEPWSVAVFVAIAAWLAHRQAGTAWTWPQRLGTSVVSLLGPGLWMAWNAYAHGDALHFHTRVSSYWVAFGAGPQSALTQLLAGYPLALVREAPELMAVLAVALLCNRSRSQWRMWSYPIAAALFGVLSLTAAQATGGAPTHHPERALLGTWMVLWVASVDLCDRGLIHRDRPWQWAARAGAVALLVCMGLTLWRLAPRYGTNRLNEEQVGTWLRQQSGSAPVLVDPDDYGYFAMMASLGPERPMLLARSIDPRHREPVSPFEDVSTLQARVRQSHASWLVVREDRGKAARQLGPVRQSVGPWQIVQVEPALE